MNADLLPEQLPFVYAHEYLPKETLIERVWGYDSDAEYNNLEVYVSFLRKKLNFIGAQVKLKATRGLGYSLEESHD